MARSSQLAQVCVGTGGRVYLVVGHEEGELEVNPNRGLAVTMYKHHPVLGCAKKETMFSTTVMSTCINQRHQN